jgi:hypothetical protein
MARYLKNFYNSIFDRKKNSDKLATLATVPTAASNTANTSDGSVVTSDNAGVVVHQNDLEVVELEDNSGADVDAVEGAVVWLYIIRSGQKMLICCGFDVWICGTASLKLRVVLSVVCRYVDLSIKLDKSSIAKQ